MPRKTTTNKTAQRIEVLRLLLEKGPCSPEMLLRASDVLRASSIWGVMRRGEQAGLWVRVGRGIYALPKNEEAPTEQER